MNGTEDERTAAVEAAMNAGLAKPPGCDLGAAHAARIAEIEASDVSGPNKLALVAEATLPELLRLRDAATTKTARRKLDSRIKVTRMLLNWAKTRAGYVKPPRRAEG